MGDYFDRYVRDEAHLWAVMRYMEENPVKAGLVRLAREWPWIQAVCRIRMRAGRPRSRVEPTDRSPRQHDSMVVTAISAAFGHARGGGTTDS